ncbi:unnamed protein product [Durusdinium trenchii]|uniref:Uncharacterized protein n=2 Tax=Durusdinium trenchii TaxID=1381693 RepID=A0ABP0S0E6_9DINO
MASFSSQNGRASAHVKMLAASLTLTEAEVFVKRCMTCLSDELQTNSSGRPAGASQLAAVIKGEAPASSTMAFMIEYWQSDEKVGGDVQNITAEEALNIPTRVEISNLSVLLDLATGRLSPVVAMVRRQVKATGDVQAARLLAPALRSAVLKVAGEFEENRPATSRSMISSYGSWMPNDASPGCVLCGRPWMPLVRLRHHCRTCGSLVCNRCSICSHGRHSRKCLRCQGGSVLQPSIVMTESFATSAASFSSTAGPPEWSRVGPQRPSVQSFPTPPGTDVEGLLHAQIQAALAPKIQKRIPASPASEREQRLWDRVVAAEKRSQEAESQRGLHAISMFLLRKLLSTAIKHMLLCSTIFLGALSDERLHTSLLSFAGERFSSFMDQLFLVFVTALAVLLMSLFRPVRLLLTSGSILAMLWLWAHRITPDSFDSLVSFRDWPSSALASTMQRHPSLAAACAFTALLIVYVRGLQSYRYTWRLTEIYITAAFPIALYFCCKCVKKALKLSDQRATEWMYDPVDRIVAPFLTKRFAALGGLFVKAGQWLANMAATPLVWTDHLKKLQDCAPKDTDRYVQSMLQAELGKNFKELFAEFDFDPVASASIAQVHKAVMSQSGQQVAVKLQHEGVEPMMLLDLDALRRVLAFSCWLGGRDWDEVKSITEGWMKEMVHELDFHREVENLREVRQGLTRAGVNVVVPKEVEGFVSRRAFIMEFCEGFRFTDLDQLALWGVDRKALGERAVHAVASQLLEIGVFNSDPHGGNLLCQIQENNSAVPVLLDFGNCIRLPEEQRLLYCRLLVALSDASMSSVVEATKKLGIITSQTEAHPARDMEYMMMVFRDTGSRKSQIASLKSFRELRKSQRSSDMEALDEETKKDKKKAKAQTQRYPKKMPEEAVLFLRMMLLVRGLCSQLDAELPFLQLFEQHARRALVCKFPTVKRAIRALPLEDDDRSKAVSHKATGHVVPLVRELIAQLVLERPGLGIQACVYLGEICVLDECGGVLGSTDPRPLGRSTRMPLADLSRLPWLLALSCAERKGKIKYSDRVMSALATEATCSGSLADALSHQVIKQDGDDRESFISSPVGDLADKSCMMKKLAGSLVNHPHHRAQYLPWGAGYVAAAALQQLSNQSQADALEEHLSGLRAAQELCLESSTGEDWATLSSGLFADLRSLASGSAAAGAGNIFMGPVLGTSKKPEDGVSPGASPGPAPNGESTPKRGMSLARSVFEDAGGLLADVGLANAAAKWSAEVCPDLACAASARSLAAVFASSSPVKDSRQIHAREQPGDNASNPMSFLFSQLAPPARAWDERGFQVIELEGTSHSAVGAGSCGGLLGYAIQWPAEASKPITVVVLCNQFSMMTVPSQVVARIVDAMQLPRPIGLP